MGNPHAVVFIDTPVKEFPLEQIGPHFENHACFPRRVNTEFARVLDRQTMEMRVWERGSGETLACGTGTCATAVAGVLNGLTDRKVLVHLLGGDLEIEWNEEDDCVYMTGTATTVFDGEIALPDGQ
jgi:diaminopimelate epimerase